MSPQNLNQHDYYSLASTFINDWMREGGDINAAFRDFAVDYILRSDYSLSSDDITAITSCDRSGDMGIDGWYLSEEESTPVLHLFQSKNTTLTSSDLDHLIAGFTQLFPTGSGPFRVANQMIKDHATEFENRILGQDRDCLIKFYGVTSELVTPSCQATADTHPGITDISGRAFQSSFEVIDIAALTDTLTGRGHNAIQFKVYAQPSDFLQTTTSGGFLTTTVVVSGQEIANLYGEHKIELFRNNPRYYQQARGAVNKQMLETLGSPEERPKFYVYNNGITATCTSLRINTPPSPVIAFPEDNPPLTEIVCEDFQIVNGCQTTATLHNATQHRDPRYRLDGVLVQLKIIESGAQIAPTIARYTNSQNPMKPSDFRANDEHHERLHEEFNILRRNGQYWRWYYEYKRGTWGTSVPTRSDRTPYTENAGEDGYGVRKFDMVQVAQAATSFLGNSVVASDSPGSLFLDDIHYTRIYKGNPGLVTANQLLLPLIIYEEIEKYVDGNEDVERDPTWFTYMRRKSLHITGGFLDTLINGRLPEDINEYIDYPSNDVSELLVSTVREWCPFLLEFSYRNLVEEVRRLSDDEGITMRTVVRRHNWLPSFYQQQLRNLLSRLNDQLSDAMSDGVPPESRGFRALFPLDIGSINS